MNLRKKGGDSCGQHVAVVCPDDVLVAEGEEEDGAAYNEQLDVDADGAAHNPNVRADITGAAAVVGYARGGGPGSAAADTGGGGGQQGVGLSPFVATATPGLAVGAARGGGALSAAAARFARLSVGEALGSAAAAGSAGTRSPRANTLKRLFGLNNSGSMQPGDSVLPSAGSEGAALDGGRLGGGAGVVSGLVQAGSSGVEDGSGGVNSGGGGAKVAVRNRRLSCLMRTRSLSFRLVAAQSPRGEAARVDLGQAAGCRSALALPCGVWICGFVDCGLGILGWWEVLGWGPPCCTPPRWRRACSTCIAKPWFVDRVCITLNCETQNHLLH